jgi:8-oxo-dGTP diphosphatase
MGHHHLATGVLIRDERLLMVASRYANHAEPLWNLPGGRQQPGELLAETAVREVLEETGLRVEAGEIAYVSESYDDATHFLNVAFVARLVDAPLDSARGDAAAGSDHIVALEWVPIDEVAQRIVVAVVREPLVAYLRGELHERYAGFHDAGVTIEWPPDSR